jgi:hypothetical protein
MSILELLPVSSMLDSPFTDYLNVTVPLDHAEGVTQNLLPIIESLGPYTEPEKGLFRLHDAQLKPTKGTIKFKPRGKVLIVSASGAALQTLRDCRLYDGYLSEIGAFPHRVSMLHATQDYVVPSTSAVIQKVKVAGYAEEISLTRKRVLKGNVSALLSPNGDGEETGTVYLGHRSNADVWAKVYDKRQERLAKGFTDPGSIIRVEVAVQSDVGATLKDAHSPYDLFFNFAGKSLVSCPSTFKGWQPAGEGYVLSARSEVLPYARLQRFLEHSMDIAKLVDLSVAAYGDKAGDMLSRIFSERCLSKQAA